MRSAAGWGRRIFRWHGSGRAVPGHFPEGGSACRDTVESLESRCAIPAMESGLCGIRVTSVSCEPNSAEAPVKTKILILPLLLGISSCATLKIAPFDTYSGDWSGSERITQIGSCSIDNNSLGIKYRIHFNPNGEFKGQRYSTFGELTEKNTLSGTVTRDGRIRVTNQALATCSGVERVVTYPGTGSLVQTPSGPILTFTAGENVCPESCQFLVERELKPAK